MGNLKYHYNIMRKKKYDERSNYVVIKIEGDKLTSNRFHFITLDLLAERLANQFMFDAKKAEPTDHNLIVLELVSKRLYGQENRATISIRGEDLARKSDFANYDFNGYDFNGYDEIGASELDEIGEKVRHYVVDIMSEKKVLTVPS